MHIAKIFREKIFFGKSKEERKPSSVTTKIKGEGIFMDEYDEQGKEMGYKNKINDRELSAKNKEEE